MVRKLPFHNKKMKRHTEESVVELAISETGFGKFNIKIIIICYLIYLNTGIATTVNGYVLSAAACDFQMDTIEKGRYGSAFLLGSCISPIISGFLSDLKGRRWVLIVSLFVQGHSDLLQSFMPNYWAAMVLKLISGVAATAQIFTVITYMSECIPSKRRKSILTFIEFSWIMGHALASALGWIIIPLSFEYTSQYFFFRSWNLYVLICSLPALFIGVWLIFFPESPKYLAEKGAGEKLLQVLIEMYEENSGKPGQEYIEKLMKSGNCSIIQLVYPPTQDELLLVEKHEDKSVLQTKVLKELKKVQSIFKPPLLKNTCFACILGFCLSSSYFALFFWLPEIFQRFADFDADTQHESSNICTVSHEIQSSDINLDQQCNRTIDPSIFINNLIMAAACVPAILPITFLVNRLGFKFFIVTHSFICSGVVLGLYFVNSAQHTLILLCVYLSLISVCITGSFAFFVTIFPTNLRSTGVTLTSFASRVGGVIGNTMISYLIDYHCFYLLVVVASQLAVSAILTSLIRE